MVAVGGSGSANGRSSRTKTPQMTGDHYASCQDRHRRVIVVGPFRYHNMEPIRRSARDGHASYNALVKSSTKVRTLTTDTDRRRKPREPQSDRGSNC
jgi:hypothetical protein